ncbi:MAG: IS1595 family transposase, partial [Flavisolibacter sp.]
MKNKEKFTIADFQKRYPNDDACLDQIMKLRYSSMDGCPGCGVAGAKFYRVKSRKCYECGECAKQIYPLAGTVMQGSNTKLTLWFFAIYLFASSKNGVSAKELQRQLGVTYKTAWRMGHMIRVLMGDNQMPLKGIVEIDETLFGGKARGGKRGWGAEKKTCLFGMMERNGRVKVIAVPNRQHETLIPIITSNIYYGAMIHTDEYKGYGALSAYGYGHKKVVHSKFQWANGDVTTNSMEGYWSNLKKSIFGTHTYVSPKLLQNYLNEFDFRHNNR